VNANWLGVVSVVFAFVGFFVTYRVTIQKSLRLKLALSVFTVLLAIPGASFAIYYAHLFREPEWYYEFRSIPGTELLIVFLGIAGGCVAALLPRVFLILPLLGVAAFSIAPVMKPFVAPLEKGLLTDRWDGDVCLQSTPSTCGAASLATVLKCHGEEIRESEIAREAYSYAGGTEAWYLARAARERGYQAKFDFSEGFNPDIRLPAIIGVRFGGTGHFIPVLKREGNTFFIGDPLIGAEEFSEEEFMKQYDFTGFCLSVEKE